MGHEDQPLDRCLRHKHAVERIRVMRWECRRRFGVRKRKKTFPFHPPGFRRARRGTAVSFAIGVPFLAMMISPPGTARSTSCDGDDFASYRL